jgi:hypothetical protein
VNDKSKIHEFTGLRSLMSSAFAIGSGEFILLVAAALLAGCSGSPTAEENSARRQVTEVGRGYRPDEARPALPILTADSPASDYLRFALLNHPPGRGGVLCLAEFGRDHHPGPVTTGSAAYVSSLYHQHHHLPSCPGSCLTS